MGNDFSKGVDSAVSIITGIITGDMTGGLAGASAPWLAEQIKIQAGDNETARGRPTPVDSERDVGKTLTPDFNAQESYLNGQKVKWGTDGSVRPDFCNGTTCSIEVKNYDIQNNINGLIDNVSKQAIERKKHLPSGVQQLVVIDIRGQKITAAQKNKIRDGIESKSNGIIKPEQIEFKTK